MSFDLQVNGYRGADFNSDALTLDQLRTACRGLEEDGCEEILATLITDDPEALCRRMRRLRAWREEDEAIRRVIRGFHLEGPFISPEPGYRGAHPLAAVRPANREDAERLLDAGGGLVRLVTLAPEQDAGGRVTRFLVGHGIVVSAGHCDPSRDQIREAIDAGLSMVTHLGNACPLQMHRHDNVIQRFLAVSGELWCCFIADGVHIPPYTLGNYLRCTGLEKAVVVTDAISAAGLGPGRYTLAGWDLVIGEDGIARSPGGDHFVGSTATVRVLRRVLGEEVGLGEADIVRLLDTNPRRALGAVKDDAA
jgi:N-acetylglucosamine-6-phosphate deacetylase